MKKLIVLMLVSLGAPAISEECVEIKNDLDRLACYDLKSGRVAKAVAEPEPVGRWNVSSRKSEFKDTTDHFLRLTSNEPVKCKSYGSVQPVTLWLRCMENTTSIFVSGDCHLTSGHGGYGTIEYRVDETKARKVAFDASTDNEALGLWSGRRAIPFVKALLNSERLLMRFTPFNQSPVTARFDTVGLTKAIEPLRKECGW